MAAGSLSEPRQSSVRVDVNNLEALVKDLFEYSTVPPESAAVVAHHLVEANQTGHDSHGVIRVPFYLEMIQAGELKPAATPTITFEQQAVALVSGEWGFGQLAVHCATEAVIRLASQHGVALAGVVRCTHVGRLGAYAEQAAAAGVVLLVFVGGFGPGHNAAPYGGARGLLGGNPLAGGFPGLSETLLVDFATTGVAAGKVLVAAAEGEQLADGLIIDKHGAPTNDPRDFLDGGALLPFGGHKGYGLAVLCELLGQCLTGADETASGAAEGGSIFRQSGALLIGIRTNAFREPSAAQAAATALAGKLRAIPPAPGFERVLAPGDPEAGARAARSESFALPLKTWQELEQAAASAGLQTTGIVLDE